MFKRIKNIVSWATDEGGLEGIGIVFLGAFGGIAAFLFMMWLNGPFTTYSDVSKKTAHLRSEIDAVSSKQWKDSARILELEFDKNRRERDEEWERTKAARKAARDAELKKIQEEEAAKHQWEQKADLDLSVKDTDGWMFSASKFAEAQKIVQIVDKRLTVCDAAATKAHINDVDGPVASATLLKQENVLEVDALLSNPLKLGDAFYLSSASVAEAKCKEVTIKTPGRSIPGVMAVGNNKLIPGLKLYQVFFIKDGHLYTASYNYAEDIDVNETDLTTFIQPRR